MHGREAIPVSTSRPGRLSPESEMVLGAVPPKAEDVGFEPDLSATGVQDRRGTFPPHPPVPVFPGCRTDTTRPGYRRTWVIVAERGGLEPLPLSRPPAFQTGLAPIASSALRGFILEGCPIIIDPTSTLASLARNGNPSRDTRTSIVKVNSGAGTLSASLHFSHSLQMALCFGTESPRMTFL